MMDSQDSKRKCVSLPFLKPLKRNTDVIFINMDTFTIGRNPTCSFIFDLPVISRHHCTIRKLPDGSHEVVSEGAASTLLNNTALEKGKGYELKNNDVLSFVTFPYVFKCEHCELISRKKFKTAMECSSSMVGTANDQQVEKDGGKSYDQQMDMEGGSSSDQQADKDGGKSSDQQADKDGGKSSDQQADKNDYASIFENILGKDLSEEEEDWKEHLTMSMKRRRESRKRVARDLASKVEELATSKAKEMIEAESRSKSIRASLLAADHSISGYESDTTGGNHSNINDDFKAQEVAKLKSERENLLQKVRDMEFAMEELKNHNKLKDEEIHDVKQQLNQDISNLMKENNAYREKYNLSRDKSLTAMTEKSNLQIEVDELRMQLAKKTTMESQIKRLTEEKLSFKMRVDDLDAKLAAIETREMELIAGRDALQAEVNRLTTAVDDKYRLQQRVDELTHELASKTAAEEEMKSYADEKKKLEKELYDLKCELLTKEFMAKETELNEKRLRDEMDQLKEDYDKLCSKRMSRYHEERGSHFEDSEGCDARPKTPDVDEVRREGYGQGSRDVKDMLVSSLESDLACSVCGELFIEATALTCSHVFCRSCIAEWKTKKKDCPLCRANLKKEIPVTVINSFLDRIKSIVPEAMQNRSQLIKERLEADQAATNNGSTSTIVSSTARRIRRTGRNDSSRSMSRNVLVNLEGMDVSVEATSTPISGSSPWIPNYNQQAPTTSAQARRHRAQPRAHRAQRLMSESGHEVFIID